MKKVMEENNCTHQVIAGKVSEYWQRNMKDLISAKIVFDNKSNASYIMQLYDMKSVKSQSTVNEC